MASREVEPAVGTAPERVNLDQRAAELRAIIERPSEKEMAEAELRVIDRQMAEEAEQAAVAAAEKRIVGVSQASGSLIAQLEADARKLLEAAQAYVAAAERINDRYRKIELLRAESDALADRFGVADAKIPSLMEPDRREVVVAAHRAVLAVDYARQRLSPNPVQKCEHGLRTRRTYQEIATTLGYDIIAHAGLKPFHELTERQRQAVEAAQGEATVGGLEALEAERERVLATPPGLASTLHVPLGRTRATS